MLRQPHLRTVLVLVNLVILLLPLGGIAFLRLYDVELVRRTESNLIVQGALFATAYKDELLRLLAAEPPGSEGRGDVSSYGVPVSESNFVAVVDNAELAPILPKLDAATDIVWPRGAKAVPSLARPDPFAQAAAERMRPMLETARRVTLAGIRVLDFRGTVVGTTGDELGMDLMSRPEVRRCLKGEHVSLLRERVSDNPTPPLESLSRGNRTRVFVAMPVIHDNRVLGAVVLSRTPLDIVKALYLKRYHLLAAALVIIAAVVLVSVLTSYTITRPVASLIGQAERVTEGKKGAAVPLDNPGTREVARLSAAFAGMAVTLQKRAEYIGAFASNVSHEFKTPIASMRGTAELLRDHMDEMSGADRERFLKMLEDDLKRLERLVRRLLDLARADLVQPGNESADVLEVVESAVARCAGAWPAVTLEHGDETATVKMAAVTLDSILSNLLDNCRQHGGEHVHAHVGIKIAETNDHQFVDITVSDDGPGISENNISRVFEQFFTTSRERGGTGLGLSIVDALVSAHGGSITVEQGSPGAKFTVRLPCCD